MSRDHALMERHVEALYTHDSTGRLARVRAHNGPPAPRFFLGRTADAVVCRYRHDVDDVLRAALVAAADTDPVEFAAEVASDGRSADEARYSNLLARSSPVTKVWRGPAFRFPTKTPDPAAYVSTGSAASTVVVVTDTNVDVLHALLPAWVPDVHLSAPLFALLVDGQAVAVCGSVRITDSVHEAGVDTAPSFRGRGYAPQVVAKWAEAVRALGAEPLYSTSWNNAPSRAVARKLGLVLYGTDLSIS